VSKIDTAMILAAGLGNRMRPLTDNCPKPLITIADKPLITYALEQIERAGLHRVIINVHYLADQVETFVKNYHGPLELILSNERDLLRETGGGVCHALPLIDRETIVVLNADNIWVDHQQPTLTELLERWSPDTMDALLLLTATDRATGYDGVGDFYLDNNIPQWRNERATAPFVFSGMHLLKTELFTGYAPIPFSLTTLWRDCAARNQLRAHVHTGKWYHVGTPEGVEIASAKLAANSLA
jgi:N-acetyl-alpha-D-muramate 1-phosphate uridylyltransferase